MAHRYDGANIRAPATGKHFLHIDDFSRDELQDMLDKGLDAKKRLKARDESFKPFAGQVKAMSMNEGLCYNLVSVSSCPVQTTRWHITGPTC